MKVIKFILKSILYILYFILTLDARNRYSIGKHKGMHCWKISSGVGSFTPHFESKKPVRQYLTWKEFRLKHKF